MPSRYFVACLIACLLTVPSAPCFMSPISRTSPSLASASKPYRCPRNNSRRNSRNSRAEIADVKIPRKIKTLKFALNTRISANFSNTWSPHDPPFN